MTKKSLIHFSNVKKVVQNVGESELGLLPCVLHIETLQQTFGDIFQQFSDIELLPKLFVNPFNATDVCETAVSVVKIIQSEMRVGYCRHSQ